MLVVSETANNLILIYRCLLNRQEIRSVRVPSVLKIFLHVSNKFHARYRCFEYALNAFDSRFRHANVRYTFFSIFFLILSFLFFF